MRGDVELEFADGSYLFRITINGADEIQRKCNAGLGEVYARVLSGRYFTAAGPFGNPTEGRWRVEDLVEIIRQGLIGGGKGRVDDKPVEVDSVLANQLIKNYVAPERFKVLWDLASAVIYAAHEGIAEDAAEAAAADGSKKKGQTPTKPSAKSKAGSTTQKQ